MGRETVVRWKTGLGATLVALALSACGSTSGGEGAVGTDVGGYDIPAPPVDVPPAADVPVTTPDGFAKPETTDVDLGDGTFGDPCVTNEDCGDGFCVQGPQGSVCTRTCMSDCPEGWACQGVVNLVPDVVFICVPLGVPVCQPCQADVQCSEGRCVDLGRGNYCLPLCVAQADCGAGFDCLQQEDGTSICMPQTESCTCRLPSDAGKQETCVRETGDGVCYGVATCDPTVGWTGCNAPEPAPEVCDGQDNDCDRFVDEELPTRGCANESGLGRCVGTERCLGTEGWFCDAPSPAAELCDYLDNDCDGATDEDFKAGDAYGTFDHCGACNASCDGVLPHATAACDATVDPPRCAVATCDPGYTKLNNYQCIPDAAGLCEPCDTDEACLFEGARCLSLADGRFCGKACASAADCPGGYGCIATPDGSHQCVPNSGSCTCSATTPDLARSCSLTWSDPSDPTLPQVTCYGIQRCNAGGWGTCELPTETCDSLDNDCDGRIDEGFRDPDSGHYVLDEHCGQCNNNCGLQVYPQGYGTCALLGAAPECLMLCQAGWFNVDGNPANGCECRFLSTTDRPDGQDQNCDGVDGETDNGVFVSKDGDDAGGNGSLGNPVRSITRALDLARMLGLRDIYVATGLYEESLLLRQNVHVYGGYSADFLVHDPQLYETTVFGEQPTAQLPATVNAVDLAGEATLDGFTVFGVNRFEPGQTSIAVYLRNVGSGLVLTNNRIVAADGAAGVRGADGAEGQDGVDGGTGRAAYEVGSATCSGTSAGGGGGQRACSGTSVSGGEGGDAQCPNYDEDSGQVRESPYRQTHAAGESGSTGANSGGAGGEAGFDSLLWSESSACGVCNMPRLVSGGDFLIDDGADGGVGRDGNDGTLGAGCPSAQGSFPGGLWAGGAGGDGQSGTSGAGGGGGGAGGGVETVGCVSDWRYSDFGGSGGGGGSGGCAAGGGRGGTAGGGSFGVLLLYSGAAQSLPTLRDNTVQTGRGGRGGDGGNGGRGGTAGVGGAGGPTDPTNNDIWCASSGGYGGDGGRGGHGGGGGGGCGGVSYGLYVHGAGGLPLQTIGTSANTFELRGAGGAGGAGGASLGRSGTAGATGAGGATSF